MIIERLKVVVKKEEWITNKGKTSPKIYKNPFLSFTKLVNNKDQPIVKVTLNSIGFPYLF